VSLGRGPVVVDTSVFSLDLVDIRKQLLGTYDPMLRGRPVHLAFVTVAEARFGAKRAGWGAARLARLENRLSAVDIVWPGPALVESYVDLRATCVELGLALGAKVHEADRWVAATALRLDIPLVAHDRVFTNVPGLEVRTALA